ncbi:protein of unknown function [Tepidibacter aestuarii]|nr:protein of unknown function [Tepidibacter aestuarii]
MFFCFVARIAYISYNNSVCFKVFYKNYLMTNERKEDSHEIRYSWFT